MLFNLFKQTPPQSNKNKFKQTQTEQDCSDSYHVKIILESGT